MEYKNTPEYAIAQERISNLLSEISQQVQEISLLNDDDDTSDVDQIIAEQDKSGFIFKQAELINAYGDRDTFDDRGSYIAKLESELAKAKEQSKFEYERWVKEYRANQSLKSALKSLTEVLSQD